VNASEENAARARAAVDSIAVAAAAGAGGGERRKILEGYFKVLYDFPAAAGRKLPTEAAYARDHGRAGRARA
jgi:hypothetical protein